MKRLERDMTNKMVGGVAAGIANYFAIDPTIVRILFIVFTIFGGTGFLAYIVCWILIPANYGIPSQGPPPKGFAYFFGLFLVLVGIAVLFSVLKIIIVPLAVATGFLKKIMWPLFGAFLIVFGIALITGISSRRH